MKIRTLTIISTLLTLTAALTAFALFNRDTQKDTVPEKSASVQASMTSLTETKKVITDTVPKKEEKTENPNSPEIDSMYHFNKEVTEIKKMLDGEQRLSFERAVFLVENALMDGQLNYEQYVTEIDKAETQLTSMIEKAQLRHVPIAGLWAVFTYMTQAIPENNYQPYQYDFENFMGDKDFTSFLVTNLLDTKKGNCHSLPYYFKILANRVNVEAYLATAPLHLFIKHKDEKGKWWNLELTSGTYSRTTFIMESFNVTDAGMQSGLYMKPLDQKESVALCLTDLIEYYYQKHDNIPGEFTRKCYEAGLKYYPNSLLQLYKLDYLKYTLDKDMEAKGLNDYKQIDPYPELVKQFKEMEKTEIYIREMGYTTLTPEQYKQKVLEINSEKEKQ